MLLGASRPSGHQGRSEAGRGDDRIDNGALDNAAGIATLLEVARPRPRPRTSRAARMIFLATTAEEKGLLGADYFARNPTVPIGQIVGNVDLDMPLLLYPFTDVIAFGANHSTIGKLVAEPWHRWTSSSSPDPMPEQGVFTRSDHYQFVTPGCAGGVPGHRYRERRGEGLGRIPGRRLSQPASTICRRKSTGRPAREISPKRTTGSRGPWPTADTPPLWYEGDYFGDTFAPKAARAAR